MTSICHAWWKVVLAAALCVLPFSQSADAATPLKLDRGDRVILIGNTLAERMQQFGHWETLLHSRFPQLELVVRNLGWSADELTIRLRSKDFKDHGHTLHDHKPDVILAFFGFNESFGGEAGLAKFKTDLENFIKETTTTSYNGKNPPQLVLVSPIANEDLPARKQNAGQRNNGNIKLYTEAMKAAADAHGVMFVDLFTPTLKLMKNAKSPLTFNGIHLTDDGYRQLAPVLDEGLFGSRPSGPSIDMERLRAEVNEKNLQFWFDYRSVNGYYIYGGRKEPFGVVNFPAEFAKLRKMVAVRDRRVWDVAQGKAVPAQIDDSDTGEFVDIQTNIKFEVKITPPEDSRQQFRLPEGYEVNLFASEVEFPDLQNPVQMTFDSQGRLWVCTMPSYPQYLPGVPVNDKILILEDTDGDGKADKQTVFADGLHVPTGIELADGGAYVAAQPNLLFLKDTDGDGKADHRETVLHGFDSADSHHSISAFEIGPGGALYFQEGTFHQTQVETPYGPQRCSDAGVFRYEPRTEKFEVFVSYRFANPWGHVFDRWGQNFVADASGGANYFGTAFSGQVDYPQKHSSLKQFFTKQWRPTAGCELVSSRNFPEDTQGDYLLNNCIGFHGVLRYRMKDDGSGFSATPVEPLLQSADPNFRPVDLQFGPDGALYVVDWFNPLIGHMQHSLRDPNRDKNHGRIWRITYKDRPLVKSPKIAGEPTANLLELLKEYEDRTRYRVRRELRERDSDEVKAEIDKWVAAQDPQDPEYWHHLLEALWVLQHHDIVDQPLLKKLLRCPEPRARAAATRVLCYWRDRVDGALGLLRVQAGDEHPRVRLEAVRAASFFKGEDVPKAEEVALESLLHDQDAYLEYTLKETLSTLERRAKK